MNTEKIHQNIDKTNQVAHQKTDKLADSIHQAVDSSSEKSHSWLNQGLDKFNQVQKIGSETYHQYSDNLNRSVVANPVKSLLIAGTTGIILGLLFSKRK